MNLDLHPAVLLRRTAGLLYAAMHERRRTLMRPVDEPSVRSGSGSALRVVLIGNGLVHGWGVASHQLAATGELARGLRTLTGAATAVDLVGDAAMSAATALDWVGDRIDGSYHGAVVAIGSNDALRLTPVADWGAHLVGLLDAVQQRLPEGAQVVVVGIPDVFVPNRVRPLNPLVARHARRLDRVTARLAGLRTGVTFLPAPRLTGHAGRAPDGDLYSAFAVPIAVAVAEALREADVQVHVQPPGERFDRADVRSVIEAARWDELPELTEIVQRARSRFGVTESAVTLLDGDRSWHVASNGVMPVSVPKQLSYCETVVATDEALVVGDAKRDPRFAGNPFLELVHAPFYAGVPLHAEDGTPIGALCLVHGFPRNADTFDLEGLRELAHETEEALRAAARTRRGEPLESAV